MPYLNARSIHRLTTQPGSYTQVMATSFIILPSMLKRGINIFGVASGLATTLYLPKSIPSNRLIAINDESGMAASSNITIQGI